MSATGGLWFDRNSPCTTLADEQELAVRFPCPACGAECDISKRRLRRTRRTRSPCAACGAVLGICSGAAGALDIEILQPGTRPVKPPAPEQPAPERTVPEPAVPEPALIAPHRHADSDLLPLLPDVAVVRGDGEVGFDAANEEKTDPDARAPISAFRDPGLTPMRVVTAPSATTPTADHREIPFGQTHEDTDPGVGPLTLAGQTASGTFFGAADTGVAAPPPVPDIPVAVTDAPLTLEMPEPRRKRSRQDVQTMLQEFSVMFRLDNKHRRTRNLRLGLAAVVVVTAAIIGVASTSGSVQPAVLSEVAVLANGLRPARATQVVFTDDAGASRTVSALGRSLVGRVHDRRRVQQERVASEIAAARRLAEQATAAREAQAGQAAQQSEKQAEPEQPSAAKRKRRRRAKRRKPRAPTPKRRTLPDLN